MKCPRCGNRLVLTTASVPLIVMAVGPELGVGIPFGTSFSISAEADAICNRASCKWQGLVRELLRDKPDDTQPKGAV